jgi:hypothetical protein
MIDYNKTTFAPPGCKIIAHEKPHKGELGPSCPTRLLIGPRNASLQMSKFIYKINSK